MAISQGTATLAIYDSGMTQIVTLTSCINFKNPLLYLLPLFGTVRLGTGYETVAVPGFTVPKLNLIIRYAPNTKIGTPAYHHPVNTTTSLL